jgi:hypothetical protein
MNQRNRGSGVIAEHKVCEQRTRAARTGSIDRHTRSRDLPARLHKLEPIDAHRQKGLDLGIARSGA